MRSLACEAAQPIGVDGQELHLRLRRALLQLHHAPVAPAGVARRHRRLLQLLDL